MAWKNRRLNGEKTRRTVAPRIPAATDLIRRIFRRNGFVCRCAGNQVRKRTFGMYDAQRRLKTAVTLTVSAREKWRNDRQ